MDIVFNCWKDLKQLSLNRGKDLLVAFNTGKVYPNETPVIGWEHIASNKKRRRDGPFITDLGW